MKRGIQNEVIIIFYIADRIKWNKNKILRLVFLWFLFISSVFTISAQTIKGYVYTIENGKKNPLPGATVYYSGTNIGTSTDSNGAYNIDKIKDQTQFLIAKLIGYTPDSLHLTKELNSLDFILSEGVELNAVVVDRVQDGTVLSRLTVSKTELITKTGLTKMACCNLSESFENSATVTVGFTDAISGAKQVQLLGLSGIYSQMQSENIPIMRGLAASFGWSYIPGTWLESIQISKGASSVVNGYESIAGQINVEMKKPNYTEPLFVNLYADDAERFEANITAATKVFKDLWTGLLLHGSTEQKTHDDNGDSFLDTPKSKFVNVYNRWFYLNDGGIQSRTGLKFLYDKREGGQDSHHTGYEMNESNHYQTNIDNKSFSVENKTGFTIGTKEGQSIGLINSFNYYEEDLNYGKKSFNGLQNTFYSNALFTSPIGESHQYTLGASFLYDNYRTRYEDNLPYNNTASTPLNRTEVIPGLFGEYTYSLEDKFTFIIGARGDYNSKYGWLFTPRANVRYNPSQDVVFRISVGKGYRSPNAIADNIGLLASSRKFHIETISELGIEKAWNYGGNITLYIPIWDERKITLSLDYFHTRFQNQVITDTERNRNSVFYYNLQGTSYADAFQADLSFSPFKGLDVFAAFRYNDTKITYAEGGQNYKMEKPLTSRYRGLINLSYATNLRKWVFDFTAQINGPTRLPGLNGYNSEIRRSESFPVFFSQITRNSKRFDLYLGVENIFDYKQKDPILNSNLPFSQDFDSSMIWGPLMGRRIYAGLRLRLGKLP